MSIPNRSSSKWPEHLMFKFQKRTQLFIRTHNETLPIAAMCVCDPDCSTVGAASFKLA
jgi:hypothetical protein